MPGITHTGLAFEASQHAHLNDPFYTLPDTFSSTSKPGSVLSVEPITDLANYTVPSGLTMSRIIYTTTNLNGTSLPASAYVLWPYQPYEPKRSKYDPQDQGIPMVAWAHGTAGSAALCSPSNYQALQYNFIVPFHLALAGFAVVAPDYAGLGVGYLKNGTRIPHAWLSSPSQANDLANAIIAARTAFPALSKRFVVMGHSQGGGATYAFAERQAHTPVSGYLGSIPIAPPTTVIEQITAALQNLKDQSLQVSLGYQQKAIAAITADYPAYNFSGMTALTLARWQIGQKYGGCLPTESLLLNDVVQQGKPGWFADKTVQIWAGRVSTGGKPLVGPFLLIASQADLAVPVSFVQASLQESGNLKENKNQSIEFAVYEGLNHFPVIDGSQLRWLSWIRDRFDGVELDQKCVSHFVNGPRVNGTKQSIVPNWLIELPASTEVWKASL